MKACFSAALVGLAAAASHAQNLLPNPGFEAGGPVPTGWRLAEGAGEWLPAGSADTNHVLRVHGQGADTSVWSTDPLPLRPGAVYRLSFRARRLPGADGGTAVSGTSAVNRDFPLDSSWRRYRFYFRQPDLAPEDFVRLGQWHVRGGLEFDDVQLVPAQAAHRRVPWGADREIELGEGEMLSERRYQFTADYGWRGSTLHRPLTHATARFNTDRWVFAPGAELVYRFGLPGLAQSRARASVSINHHVAGVLVLEARRDGEPWQEIGRGDAAQRGGSWDLPARLFPATNLWVRLHTPAPDTALQVNHLEYEAALDADPPEAFGETRFLEVTGGAHPERITWRGFTGPDAAGRYHLEFELSQPDPTPLCVTARLTGPAGTTRPSATPRWTVPAGQRRGVTWELGPFPVGEHIWRVTFHDAQRRKLLEGQGVWEVGFLDDTSYGYRLPGPPTLDLWWCESGWKVGRQRPLPAARPRQPVRLSAARGEFEAVQIVLRPRQPDTLREVRVGPFRDAVGRAVPLTTEVNEVAYVRVRHPTDSVGRRGWYPDPLPPLTLPRGLEAGANQPLWVTVYVPPAVPAGEYRGEVVLTTDSAGSWRVPLVVRVYGFALPRQSHLRSALGLGWGEIIRYHQLRDRPDQVAVFEKYLQNFAEHRVSPYSFFDHAPIAVRFEGTGADKRAQVDFTAFDAAAARWLDGQGLERGSPFNAFRLPLHGMGGGTFHRRHLGELEGFAEGTPEHARLFGDYLGRVVHHLRERGWLERAYTYWFDEPDPKDYAFVIAGQQRIHAAAPGLKRLLTEQPEPELFGHVDIWCGLTPEWTPEKVRARQAAGEEVWWYICTVPKAPYLTGFIDHPGTELRLWPWQSWQYGVDGILIWSTTYWHSPEAYPDALQDPWQDPMSWVTSYGTPRGTRLPWGNGDGRFLYPPRRDPNTATAPALEGPINSVRWENLRDGLEDYEYFWRLRQEVQRLEARGQAPAWVAAARRLLSVPAEVSKDLTHFTTDPRPLLAHRDRLARMIERLQTVR